MTFGFAVLGLVAIVGFAIGVELYLKRNKRKPLSSGQPAMPRSEAKKELGMEATDTELVDATHSQNEEIQKLHKRLTKRRR